MKIAMDVMELDKLLRKIAHEHLNYIDYEMQKPITRDERVTPADKVIENAVEKFHKDHPEAMDVVLELESVLIEAIGEGMDLYYLNGFVEGFIFAKHLQGSFEYVPSLENSING